MRSLADRFMLFIAKVDSRLVAGLTYINTQPACQAGKGN
ncbi:MAG: hypothetical protein [Olavius algarvensis spirochete endosymbiont]|nr:MAG: hypothetical protein [Olavius algarvensis spirochete endosymbiont]